MYNLHGKVALVTGAGGEHGIGRAIATRLAQEGADVAVTDIVSNPYGRSSSGWEGASSVVREIEAMGRQAMAVVADVSKADQVQNMTHQVLERFGRIDILVNNAGSRPGRDRVPLVDLEEDAWDEVMDVNVKGTFLCCRAVARHMIERGDGGKIINMSSTSGKVGRPRFGVYCASKFAVRGLTQSLAQELGSYRITVNAICPTAVDTERTGFIASALSSGAVSGETWMTSAQREAFLEERATITPLGRVTRSSDIATVAAFLASSEADYLTGLDMVVSGGAEIF